jgi:hypothetical protein
MRIFAALISVVLCVSRTTVRPVFAPETSERNVTKRGERDERSLISLQFFAERSLHTGEVVGSIPTAPTIEINTLAFVSCDCAHVSPMKRVRARP